MSVWNYDLKTRTLFVQTWMSSIITEASRKLTSSILEAQIRETPNVSKTNRKPNQRKDEIELSNPSFPHIFWGSHELSLSLDVCSEMFHLCEPELQKRSRITDAAGTFTKRDHMHNSISTSVQSVNYFCFSLLTPWPTPTLDAGGNVARKYVKGAWNTLKLRWKAFSVGLLPRYNSLFQAFG